MRKKDYELIMSTISLTLGARKNPDRRAGIKDVALDLAYRFQQDNPKFDRVRFLKGCGLGDGLIKADGHIVRVTVAD